MSSVSTRARSAPRVSVVNGFAAIPENHTYFIAEAGNNHNGSMELARQLIDVAVECGADAIKFQKRDVESMLTGPHMDRPFSLPGEAEDWGDTYRKVREHIELNMDQFAELKEYCQGKIDFVVTPFDLKSCHQLAELGVDAYKIAGFSISDIPLLEEVSKTDKTIFMSIGACTDDEVHKAIEILKNNDLVLLHCISSYPMKPEDANLGLIDWLKQFGYPVGWSDHEVGITLSPVAVALGARVVERHYTVNRALPGFDHAMSLEPTGLKKVIRDIRKVEVARQGLRTHREILPCELKSFDQKRKSLVTTRAVRKGETLTRDMFTTKGPNRGLSPRYLNEILGREAAEDIDADTHVTFSMVKM
jgi:sialic acid synthase SpsE